MLEEIKNICAQFAISSTLTTISEFNSGHINDTYLIHTNSSEKYVLQKMNADVFTAIEDVISNKVTVSNFIAAQYEKKKSAYKTIRFIKTHQQEYLLKDKNDKDYWNMMLFIPNSITYTIAKHVNMVYEAGKLFGDFIAETNTLPAEEIITTLPNFHNMASRYEQFEKALAKTSEELKQNAKVAIDFAIWVKSEMLELSILKENNTFPIRITHNDAKLSNILFDKNDKGLSVIDLDTVMQGIVHFDFGDSIRSICTNASEDETDLSKVSLNLDSFHAYCKGFAENTAEILTPKEILHLPLAGKTITFIMGLRFLTDYLNDNIYYKVTYDNHNLDRAKNQFALTQDMQKKQREITEITYQTFGFTKS